MGATWCPLAGPCAAGATWHPLSPQVSAKALPQAKGKQFVSVTAKVAQVTLEKVLLVSPQSGHIFLQTDKPIYTPGTTGVFLGGCDPSVAPWGLGGTWGCWVPSAASWGAAVTSRCQGPAAIWGQLPGIFLGTQHPFLDVLVPPALTLSPVSPPSALPHLRRGPPHEAGAQDGGRGGQGGCQLGTWGCGDTATHATVPNHSLSLQTPDNVIIKQLPVSSPMKTGIMSFNHYLPEIVR